MDYDGVEIFEVGRPKGKVHPERQPESFTEEELVEQINDLDKILSDDDESKRDESKREYASTQLGLLHLLLEAKKKHEEFLELIRQKQYQKAKQQ